MNVLNLEKIKSLYIQYTLALSLASTAAQAAKAITELNNRIEVIARDEKYSYLLSYVPHTSGVFDPSIVIDLCGEMIKQIIAEIDRMKNTSVGYSDQPAQTATEPIGSKEKWCSEGKLSAAAFNYVLPSISDNTRLYMIEVFENYLSMFDKLSSVTELVSHINGLNKEISSLQNGFELECSNFKGSENRSCQEFLDSVREYCTVNIKLLTGNMDYVASYGINDGTIGDRHAPDAFFGPEAISSFATLDDFLLKVTQPGHVETNAPTVHQVDEDELSPNDDTVIPQNTQHVYHGKITDVYLNTDLLDANANVMITRKTQPSDDFPNGTNNMYVALKEVQLNDILYVRYTGKNTLNHMLVVTKIVLVGSYMNIIAVPYNH